MACVAALGVLALGAVILAYVMKTVVAKKLETALASGKGKAVLEALDSDAGKALNEEFEAGRITEAVYKIRLRQLFSQAEEPRRAATEEARE